MTMTGPGDEAGIDAIVAMDGGEEEGVSLNDIADALDDGGILPKDDSPRADSIGELADMQDDEPEPEPAGEEFSPEDRMELAVAEQMHRLRATEVYLASQVGQPPSPDLIESHGPGTYLAEKDAYEQRVAQAQYLIDAARHEAAAIQHEADYRKAWRIAEQGERAEALLKDILPADPQGLSFDERLDSMIAWADKRGLTGETLGMAALSPELWLMVDTAMRSERKSGRKAPAPRREPQTIEELAAMKPSRSSPTSPHEAKRRHERNPSLRTLADLMP